jgi:hypothetical protein
MRATSAASRSSLNDILNCRTLKPVSLSYLLPEISSTSSQYMAQTFFNIVSTAVHATGKYAKIYKPPYHGMRTSVRLRPTDAALYGRMLALLRRQKTAVDYEMQWQDMMTGISIRSSEHRSWKRVLIALGMSCKRLHIMANRS